jgi:putative hydrolase of the HAD superfamily
VTATDLVLCDLDETLLDHGSASRAGLLRYLDALGHELDPDRAFERWHALEELHYPRYLAGELGHQEQRRVRVREFLAPLGVVLERDADVDEWFAGVQRGAHAA